MRKTKLQTHEFINLNKADLLDAILEAETTNQKEMFESLSKMYCQMLLLEKTYTRYIKTMPVRKKDRQKELEYIAKNTLCRT